MLGRQVKAYVGGRIEAGFKTPVEADKIVKTWAPTYDKAEVEKRRMERKFDDAIVQIE